MKDILGWKFPDSDNLLSRKVKEFPNTTYQQEAIDAALTYVKNFNVAVDIGANVGLHSVRFSQKFNQVFSFEPSSMNYECLVENTKSFNNINIYKKGLGDKEDKAILSLPEDSTNCGACSIIDFREYEGNLISEEIEIITLDSLNLKPDLIKIDTQTFELQVLTGSVSTIREYSPVLILEIEYKKPTQIIKDFLKNFGYELVQSERKDKIFVRI